MTTITADNMLNRRSPWGWIDHALDIVPGIVSVSTPSHGGIKLDRAHNAKVPDYMRHEGGWYEEDCDWAIPYCVFKDEILAGYPNARKVYFDDGKDIPKSCLGHWNPDGYERFYGEVLLSGKSTMKDQAIFKAENVGNYVVT